MLLTDASILIGYGRGKDARLVANVAANFRLIAIAGVTRTEVLHGRTHSTFALTQSYLDSMLQVITPEPIWDLLAIHTKSLQSKGVIVPFQDTLLATIAIHHNIELWSRDNHFPMIQAVLPALKLYQELP